MHPHIDRMIDAYDRGRLSRRRLIVELTGLFGVAAGLGATQDSPRPTSTFGATEINHIALAVTDVSRSRKFYEEHLGLTLRSDNSPHSVFLDVGKRDFLALFRSDKPGMDHYCYTVEGYAPADATKRLETAALEPRRRGNRVYFDDPDGLEVQVSAANA